MSFEPISKETMDFLVGALLVTKAWRDDLLIINTRHGMSIDEASEQLWVDVMHPAAGDTWVVSLIPNPQYHPDVVAAALAYRARHYARSHSEEMAA